MTRYYANGIESAKIYNAEENIQFSQQWVLDDKFLVYTWHQPEIREELPSGSSWKAEVSVKTIFYGSLHYKDNILDLLNSTASEFALFQSQREQNGTITETGYGYTFEEDIPFQSLNGNVDDLASKVSFSYSNDPNTIWGPTSPKLSNFPISDDRSVIEESLFGNYILEGWIDNPFSISLSSSSLTDFQALNYIASNNDLISALRIDIEAAKSHYINYGKTEGRSLDSFSASDYLAKYSDLSAAFGNDETLALQHYIQSGYAEGRTDSSSVSSSGSTTSLPTALSDLEALQYIASNPDLIGAFGTNIDAAKSHYLNNGYAEGRSITDFNPTNYLNYNSDLAAAFGTNTEAAIKHFITNGYAEGRTDSSSGSSSDSSSSSSSTNSLPTALSDFEALNYIASHSDLMGVFGIDTSAASSHYVNSGYSEGRTKDDFDEWGYLASNTDLMGVFGSNTTEAIKHYISYGKSEGRSTNIFNAESYLNNYADLKSAFGNDHTLATKHYVESGFFEGRSF